MRKTNKRLKQVTGRWLKDCYKWLLYRGIGCCHIAFGTTASHEVCVCVGWTDCGREDKIAWKIGWQTFSNAMQCDFDFDFEMPWNTKAYCEKMNAKLTDEERKRGYRYVEGDVYDTQEIIEMKEGRTTPQGYRDWNALASFIRKTARKVLACAKEVDPVEK